MIIDSPLDSVLLDFTCWRKVEEGTRKEHVQTWRK